MMKEILEIIGETTIEKNKIKLKRMYMIWHLIPKGRKQYAYFVLLPFVPLLIPAIIFILFYFLQWKSVGNV